jgi:antitoxin VapB
MPLYMLDTNMCIYIRRQQPETVLARFDTLSPGDAVISVVTFGELRYGAEKSQARNLAHAALVNFVSTVAVAPMDAAVAEVYMGPSAPIWSAEEKSSEPMISGSPHWLTLQGPPVYTLEYLRGCTMTTAKVFRSGNSQAVRLPKEFRFDTDEVEIFRRGDEVVLRARPRDPSLARAFELLCELPIDDIRDEGDLPPQQREGL